MPKDIKRKENSPDEITVGNTGRFLLITLLLTAALLIGLIANVNIGSVNIDRGKVAVLVWQGVKYWTLNLCTRGSYAQELSDVINSSVESRILFSIRLPRMLLAVLLGGALSISGYLLQVFFRNPIAGPFELGISSGAKMVVGITLIFIAKRVGNLSPLALILASFLGSILITCIVLLFSQKVSNMAMLLVIGIMVGYVCSAVTDFCITFADDHDIVNLTNWSMGSFSGSSWEHVATASVICLLGLISACLLSKPIGAYALGENYAKSMGINVKLFRLLLILLSSVLSACVTAFAGPISFIGIAVPHITRTLMKTSKPIFIIPTVFLCGAAFCVFCDLLARTLLAPSELKIGTITAVFGAPVVIYMMVKRNQLKEV